MNQFIPNLRTAEEYRNRGRSIVLLLTIVDRAGRSINRSANMPPKNKKKAPPKKKSTSTLVAASAPRAASAPPARPTPATPARGTIGSNFGNGSAAAPDDGKEEEKDKKKCFGVLAFWKKRKIIASGWCRR